MEKPKYKICYDEINSWHDIQKVTPSGVTVTAIKALKDFGNVKKGDYGGYVSSYACLDQSGDCWIDEFSIVVNSYIGGDSYVEDSSVINSEVCDNSVIKDSVCFDSRIGDCSVIENSRVVSSKIVRSKISDMYVRTSDVWDMELSDETLIDKHIQPLFTENEEE